MYFSDFLIELSFEYNKDCIFNCDLKHDLINPI